jgi:hypothetical protein
MAQPANQFQPRQLVRSVPFSTPRFYVGALAAAPAGMGFGFDVALALSDRNQIGYDTPQLGFQTIATGIFLDASVFSDQAGTLDVTFTASTTSQARSVMPAGTPVVVPANTLTLIAGLRVIGCFVTLNYVNTGGAANIELYGAIRSQ